METALIGILFGLIGLAIFLSVQSYLRAQKLKQRLEKMNGSAAASVAKQAAPAEVSLSHTEAQWQVKVEKVIAPVARLSTPKEGWETSGLQTSFIQAGLREKAWPTVFFAIKSILALIAPVLLLAYLHITDSAMPLSKQLLLLLVLVAAGYYLPNIVLKQMLTKRQEELELAMPDALDLMIVCVEAGLGLDAAMNRAANEIGIRSQILADELHLVSLELRVGLKRDIALQNLALRTGVESIRSFVTMLIQADRFGTNIAEALRTQSDTMRAMRSLKAEERAAQIPIKLLLPLIFCIFPSLLLVIMGPAGLSIMKTLGQATGSG